MRGLGWFIGWSEGLPSATALLGWHQVLFLLFVSSPAYGALSLGQQKAELALLLASRSVCQLVGEDQGAEREENSPGGKRCCDPWFSQGCESPDAGQW